MNPTPEREESGRVATDFEEWMSHHLDCPYRSGVCDCAALNRDEEERFRKAEVLNERPDTCWASLVTWALGWHGPDEIFIDGACRRDAEALGECMCGKVSRSQPQEAKP